MQLARRALARRRPLLREERGSLLVEVMVGCLVLGITTVAVLDGLDGAQATGRANKDRTEYATLAQQDIERLRSMPITALANLDQTRTVTVGAVNYTVRSEADWVRDASGVVSCTDDNAQAEYLRLRSTVSSPASADQPVTETTLLTPAPGAFSATAGTAAVRLTDRDGNPLEGVTVAMTGPSSISSITNELGCAIFAFIPQGNYTAQVTTGVSWTNATPATATVTVNAGRTSLAQIEIDQAASIRAFFQTPGGTRASAAWNAMTMAHAKLPSPGSKTYPQVASSTRVTAIDATTLFPHRDAYGVYAGKCLENNPAFWDPDYFVPGGPGYVALGPGDNLVAVDVVMPTLAITVTKSSTRPATVTARQIDDADPGAVCNELFAWPTAPSGATTVTFQLQLPFGKYRICVDDGTNRKQSGSYSPVSSSIPEHHNLTPPTGPLAQTDAVNMNDSTGRTSGQCQLP